MEGAAEGYKPDPEFELVSKDPLIDLSLSDSKELWLLQLPLNQDFLADIDGKELCLKLHHDRQLGSFEDSCGKAYDLFSFASQEPDATVLLSSASEPKIAGKISRRVSFVHFPDPQEFERISANKLKEMYQNSAAEHFPMQSPSSRIFKSKHTTSTRSSSKHKSSLLEVSDPSKTPKQSYVSEDPSDYEAPKLSRHGRNSAATSSLSSEHSGGSKSKKRAHPG